MRDGGPPTRPIRAAWLRLRARGGFHEPDHDPVGARAIDVAHQARARDAGLRQLAHRGEGGLHEQRVEPVPGRARHLLARDAELRDPADLLDADRADRAEARPGEKFD